MTEASRLLCMRCRAVTEDPDPDLAACPSCGSTGVPANLDDTVTLTLTTHELRILTIWASNYAAQGPGLGYPEMPIVIQGILDEIGKVTAAPLSIKQELSDVRAAFPDSTVRVYRADGTETDL